MKRSLHGLLVAGHFWLLMTVPAIALAADLAMRTLDGSTRFWWTLFVVQGLSVVGYTAANLREWACWIDGSSSWDQRLAAVQGVVVSMLAGNMAYYGGYYWLPAWKIDVPEVGCFIAAALAAYGGARYVTAALDVVLSVLGRFKANGVPPK